MKTLKILLGVCISIILYSCEETIINNPITNNNDTTLYTIEGRYINGTTNLPYTNIELKLIMDNYGYPRILKDISGPIRTDNDGYFKFTYRHLDEIPGLVFLEVYPTELYPEIDSIPINQNINETVYLSTFGSLILDIKPVSSSELYVYAGTQDTIHYTNIAQAFSDTIKNIPLSTALVAWGRTKEELRDALKGKISSQKYVKITGDPFYNKVLIQF
jgi:hypothetical protein